MAGSCCPDHPFSVHQVAWKTDFYFTKACSIWPMDSYVISWPMDYRSATSWQKNWLQFDIKLIPRHQDHNKPDRNGSLLFALYKIGQRIEHYDITLVEVWEYIISKSIRIDIQLAVVGNGLNWSAVDNSWNLSNNETVIRAILIRQWYKSSSTLQSL